MLSVANKPILLSVVMLNVVAPPYTNYLKIIEICLGCGQLNYRGHKLQSRAYFPHIFLTHPLGWRHDTQHNDIQYNDTQHIGLISDIQLYDTWHNNTLPLC